MNCVAAPDSDDDGGVLALLEAHPYPGHQALVDCVAVHLNVPEAAARQWLLQWAECNGVEG